LDLVTISTNSKITLFVSETETFDSNQTTITSLAFCWDQFKSVVLRTIVAISWGTETKHTEIDAT